MDRDKLWASVLESLKLSVSPGTFTTYFRPTSLVNISEVADRLICEVACHNPYNRDTLDKRYYGQIVSELERISGKKCELKLLVQESRRVEEQESVSKLPLFEENQKVSAEIYKRAGMRPDFTFDNYAVSGSNQMAFAAATAVAKRPGVAYNPLFIYGGVGVGKTHLMQAIGNTAITKGESAVLFCTSEEFTNDLVESIRNKSTEKIRVKYRKLKVLMIDDVQFIAGKPTAQEEFFHTFNSIQKGGGQIVMTSDKPPSEIAKLEERLKSRFGAGMIVDIGQPDFELRTAILMIKAKGRQIDLSPEVAQIAAENIEGLRELEGFLMQLQSAMEVDGVAKPSLDMAERLLKINHTSASRGYIVTPTEVINLVGEYFNLGIQQLKGDRRSKHIVWPRQILMYLLRFELKLPLEEVGRLLGGRDHTTIMHGSSKVQLQLNTDTALQNDVHNLKKKLLTSRG